MKKCLNFCLLLVVLFTGTPFVIRCWDRFDHWINSNELFPTNYINHAYATADLGSDILLAASFIALAIVMRE